MFHPSPSSHKPPGKRSHQATQHAGRHLVLLIEEFRRVPQEALWELGDVPGRGKNQELKQFFSGCKPGKTPSKCEKMWTGLWLGGKNIKIHMGGLLGFPHWLVISHRVQAPKEVGVYGGIKHQLILVRWKKSWVQGLGFGLTLGGNQTNDSSLRII